jgi:hypothetical protein
MTRQPPISIATRIFDGLQAIIGQRNIAKYLENLAHPFLIPNRLSVAYAEMSHDAVREAEADEWCEPWAAGEPEVQG